MDERRDDDANPPERKLSFWRRLGPGLITGASDDDPSGIGTYSQVGAQFGFSMLWTMLFSYPLMSAVQIVAARIGRTTGRGIAGNMRPHYPRALLYAIVTLLLLANVINLGADIGAMGAAVQMLVGGPQLLHVVGIAVASIGLQVFVPYHRYVGYLKWLTLSLFAYVVTAVVVRVPWAEALRSTVIPSLQFSSVYFTAFIAVLGTTISPYLFFWQASEEVEEVGAHDAEEPLKQQPRQAPAQFARIRFDTISGMGFSNIVAWTIILTTAATLHAHGQLEIQTAEQAAKALEPLAGRLAFALFAVGIVGTGLLAIPVLAGSAAYGVGEAMGWPTGLERAPRKAKRFYGVIAIATAVGAAQNFLHVSPMKALFWTAVINGVVAVPVLVVMMLIAGNKKVMGEFTVGPGLKILGWLTTFVMFAAAIGMFATL